MTALMTYLTCAMQFVGAKVNGFIRKEDGEVNIVAIIVLIGIAILLALIFKDRIAQLINSMFDTIDSNAQNAVN